MNRANVRLAVKLATVTFFSAIGAGYVLLYLAERFLLPAG